ncbi:hypothetical protein BGZ80_003539 [Entomortierella chlamydospora]|uniref:Uncharacterized protein n=1 Tax=Entomortierella chlamydospora TaxID=101097 RepID=A0A9P6MPD2_9FUNG|nr:hypothetical protein BGZ80_003539 [Entomortierella chlamydospora]
MAKGEADLAIRARCKELKQQNRRFVVVTTDSDPLAPEAVPTIYRPIRRGFLRYDVDQRATDLGVSCRQLTALAIVSRNDYSSGPFCLDLGINTEIIKESAAPKKSVSNIIDDCLKNDTVKNRFKKTSLEIEGLYQPSRKVYLLGSETPIDDKGSIEDAKIHKAAKALSLRYKDAKITMAANSKAKREEAQEAKVKSIIPPGHVPWMVFNQYWTIDKASLPSQDKTSTSTSDRYVNQPIGVRQGKYTCRYAVKIHDCSQPSSPSVSVPDSFKRSKWKAYVEREYSKPEEETSKKKKYQPSRRIPSCRYDLVKAMIKARQAATLTVGSLATNRKKLDDLTEDEKTAIGKLIQDCVNIGNFVKREAHIALASGGEGNEGLENIRKALPKYPDDIEGDEEDAEFSRADSTKIFQTLSTFVTFSDNEGKSYTKENAIIPVILFQSIGNAIPVQYKRCFQETRTDKNSRPPVAPIGNSFILLTEGEHLRML